MATITTAAPVARKPIYSSLFVQVLAALVLGIVLGMAVPDFAIGLKILSDAFLKLISMIVAPIVFCVVVHGIAGAGDLKKVGRVGVKALIYFEVLTTIALVVGLAAVNLLQPGVGMNVDLAHLDAASVAPYLAQTRSRTGWLRKTSPELAAYIAFRLERKRRSTGFPCCRALRKRTGPSHRMEPRCSFSSPRPIVVGPDRCPILFRRLR